MADARFSESFWTDPKIKTLEPDIKLMFVYLFTNPHRNYCGVYYLPKHLIAIETGVSVARIDRGIDTCIDRKLVSYDPLFETIFVHSMLTRQTGGQSKLSDQQLKGIANHLQTLHNCPLIKDFLDKYSHLDIPFNYTPIDTPMDTQSKSKSASNSQSESKSKSEKEPPLPPKGGNDNNFFLQSLAKLWNRQAPSALSRVNLPFSRSEKTLKTFRTVIGRHPEQGWWEQVISIVSTRPFLLGANDRGWRATFDFVVEHAEEIMDGKYSGSKAEGQTLERAVGPLTWLAKREANREQK